MSDLNRDTSLKIYQLRARKILAKRYIKFQQISDIVSCWKRGQLKVNRVTHKKGNFWKTQQKLKKSKKKKLLTEIEPLQLAF